MKLDYPELSRDSRLAVWTKMLQMAGMKVNDIDGIPDVKVNGRQIRNLVRLLKVIYPSGEVNSEQVKDICKYACS